MNDKSRNRWELLSALLAVLILVVLSTSCRAMTQPEESTPTGTDNPIKEPGPLGVGDHDIDVRHGGRDRRYRLHIPEQVLNPAPVVMALHGGGGTGPQFQEENGMDAVADREGFIVVYPEGSGVLANRLHTWNSGFNCCGYALDNNIDDVGFLRAVIDDVSRRLPIDPNQVSVTGHSNGAMMAYRFGAEAADVVNAVVAVAGALSIEDPQPSRPVNLLHIHSLDDPRAGYEGGEGPPFPGTRRTHIAEPVLPGVETWAELNGCRSEPSLVESLDGEGDDAGQSAHRLAWDCPDGVQTELLVLTGSGHGWPGVEVGRIWQSQLGPATNLVDASEKVWAFVSTVKP